jgi:hypothetical protein
MRRPVVLVLGVALAGTAALAAVPLAARADVRVFDNHPEEGKPHLWLDLTGFVQPGFIWRANDPYGPVTDDHFWLQRARLGVKASPWSKLFMRLELEMMPSPVLTDAYVDWRLAPWLWVRMGQFQLAFLRTFQFGEVNLAFIDRTLYTPQAPDRPFLRYLSPRDVGLMVTGRLGPADEHAAHPALVYWLGAFLGRGANQIRNDDNAFLYVARLQLDVLGVPFGVEAESDLAHNETARPAVGAAVYSNCDDRGEWNRGFTVDAELRWRGLYASASFVWFVNGAARGLGDALGYGPGCPGVTGAGDHVATGASAQVQWVLPRAAFPLPGQAIEVLARWDYVSPASPVNGTFFGGGAGDPGYLPPASWVDPDNAPTRTRLTFGVNWFPTGAQSLRVSLNWQMKRELEHEFLPEGEVIGIHDDVVWLQLTLGL